jgi:RNA polymerase sigma-70 factor (sigma-E family)
MSANTDLDAWPAGTVRYINVTDSNFTGAAVEGTPGDPTAAAAVGDATLAADAEPTAEVAADANVDCAEVDDVDEVDEVDTAVDIDPAEAIVESTAETAEGMPEEDAHDVGTNVAADGEPSDIVTRPTDVTETLTATALVPEVRSAPSVWDADRVVTEIYHGEYKSLVRLAVLLVHDVQTAEEVVQDAFEAMHTAWRRLRDSEKALSYLRQAVVNRSRSVLRHRTVVDKNAPKPAPDEPSAEQAAMTLIERSAVVAALRTLPDRQREAIVLRYYADLSEADIAATMGISKGAVKSHTARAMAALKSILEQETS